MSAERLLLRKLLDNNGPESRMAQLGMQVAQGAVIIYPTETIYGLGGIVDAAVHARILAAKMRPPDNPMIIIAADREACASLKLRFNKGSEILASAFWPGNLTLIMNSEATGLQTGIRISAHPFLQRLAKYCGRPLYSTSANISGVKYDGDPDVIYRTFIDTVDYVIDAGILPHSAPSTVVEVSDSGTVNIVRAGAISAEQIAATLNKKR